MFDMDGLLMWTQVGVTKWQLGTRYKFKDILKKQDTEKSGGVRYAYLSVEYR